MPEHHQAVHHHAMRHNHKKKKTPNSKFVKGLDKFMYVIAVVIPLTTIPQIIKIYGNQSAADVSLFSWIAYTISACIWLMYSIIHKEKPLIINSFMWVVLQLIVVVGIIMYG